MDTNQDPNRIVVGIDGSDCAVAALEWAVEEAKLRGCRVAAVMAWHEPYVSTGWAGAMPVDAALFEEVHAQDLERSVAAVGSELVDAHLVKGLARSTLLDHAQDAELLVVGHRGTGGIAGLLLGSVARHVVDHAPCPVVVVRPAGA